MYSFHLRFVRSRRLISSWNIDNFAMVFSLLCTCLCWCDVSLLFQTEVCLDSACVCLFAIQQFLYQRSHIERVCFCNYMSKIIFFYLCFIIFCDFISFYFVISKSFNYFKDWFSVFLFSFVSIHSWVVVFVIVHYWQICCCFLELYTQEFCV